MQQKIAMGDEFLAAKDLRLALYAYLDAVHLSQKSVQARLRLAALYARMGHLEQAIEQWEIAQALEPGNPEAAPNIAEARATLEQRAAGLPDGGAPPAPRIYKVTPEEPAKSTTPQAPAAGGSPATKP